MNEETAAGRHRLRRPGLALQLAFVLSLAILPLGLISVYQTQKVIEERQSLSGSALLDKTQQAVSVARNVINTATSSAETLSVAIPAVRDTPATCDTVLSRVVTQNRDFVFAGYVDSDLNLVCSSDDGLDVTGWRRCARTCCGRSPGCSSARWAFWPGAAR